jgi:hypothetical protein
MQTTAVPDMPVTTENELGPKVSDVLSEEEIEAIKASMVSWKDTVPVRFMYKGRNLNISSGRLMPKGINVIHQIHYWNFPRDTAKRIAKALQVQAVFSE